VRLLLILFSNPNGSDSRSIETPESQSIPTAGLQTGQYTERLTHLTHERRDDEEREHDREHHHADGDPEDPAQVALGLSDRLIDLVDLDLLLIELFL